MKILSSTYNIFFPKINNLRRRFFEVEDKLGGYFVKPFTLIPVPDEAPDEIPRMTSVSHHGHTNFSMSLNNAQIITNYSDNFQANWNECIQYIRDHIKQVYSTLEILGSGEFLFSGLSINVIFDEFEDKDPISLINEKLLNYKSNKPIYDIEHKVTYVLDEKYYCNITISNMRFYEGVIQPGITTLGTLNQKSHNVGIILDINDRYAFNYVSNYRSDLTDIESIINITDNIVSEKLIKIIKEGVFDLK